jgi:hypothetical protein
VFQEDSQAKVHVTIGIKTYAIFIITLTFLLHVNYMKIEETNKLKMAQGEDELVPPTANWHFTMEPPEHDKTRTNQMQLANT